MKKLAVIMLVCVNVLLLAMILVAALPQAQAQSIRGANNYLLMTGQIEKDYDVIYVMDLASRRLVAWQFNRTDRKLIRFRGGRNLAKDFGRAR